MTGDDLKVLLKKVSRSLPIFLLVLCLFAVGGCSGGETDVSADTDVSAFSFGENPESGNNDLTVQFLDVGQGSAALIHQGDSWMLVDGGDREYSSYVVGFLKNQGVKKLDYVVVSHYDSDHLSGVVGVLNAFACSQVLAPDYEEDTRIYQSFLDVIQEKEIPLSHPTLEEDYAFAYSSFRIVSPASYEYADPNSNSLGIRLSYGENSFLICGDSTEESEQDILYQGVDVKSDVFAANHHGSKYSNSKEFLEAVDPDHVVVSCGKGNSYGHPDASVLLSVQKLGAFLYRTDLQGTITAVSDGESIRFENEACMDYRSGTEIGEGPDEETVIETGKMPEKEPGEESAYIININTKKFHLPSCSSVEDMEEKNKEYSVDTRDELITKGYSPCKRCNP